MQTTPNVRRVRGFGRRDNGFTLVELVIAMVVLAIVASIALPSFLGSRNNSYDKEAQASIGVVLRAASALYSSQGDFSNAGSAGCGTDAGVGASLAADLQKLQPNVDVVGGSVTSTSSRVVSVDARPTFNSNGEKLGCQAFYATVFSSSGTCFVARLTFEGKFLLASSVSPIQVSSQLNTQNVAVTTWSALAANGVAYAQIRSRSSGADADNTQTLALIRSNCKAQTQSTGSATAAAYYADPGNFYQSWRDTTTNPASPPPPPCAQGGPCVLGETGPGGGTVFYVSAENFTSTGSDCDTACKYFEASKVNQSAGIEWATNLSRCFAVGSSSGDSNCFVNSIYSGSSATQAASRTAATPIGMGMANTNRIRLLLDNSADALYASGIATAFANNGKTDWHLPSKDELNQMCRYAWNLAVNNAATTCTGMSGTINGDFTANTFWSSSEFSEQNPWNQNFSDGTQGNAFSKNGQVPVRVVRAFGPTS